MIFIVLGSIMGRIIPHCAGVPNSRLTSRSGVSG
jgi:hypothetical protein